MTETDAEVHDHFLHSPCIGICELDDDTKLCLGCGRTGDEISEWSGASRDRIAEIWRLLPSRQERLNIQTRILPWTPAKITTWVQHIATSETGQLVLLARQPNIELKTGHGANIMVERIANTLRVTKNPYTFAIENLRQLRAIALDRPPANAPQKIVLALPRTCRTNPLAAGQPTDQIPVKSLPDWLEAVAVFVPDA